MNEQETRFDGSVCMKDNPLYEEGRREELQLEEETKKQRRVSNRWLSVSALVVCTSGLAVAVALVIVFWPDCSCDKGPAIQVTVQVHSSFQFDLDLAT